jgi:D-tyrosyl-tRNA(Tyr) deacylase
LRTVVTRVSSATVTVGGRITGEIGRGLLVLLGVAPSDTPDKARKLADKVLGLRIFEDENGKMNEIWRQSRKRFWRCLQLTL